MDVLLEALVWLLSAEQYQGDSSIPIRVGEHLLYTLVPAVCAGVIALPLGYLIGHSGRGAVWVVGFSGALRALPSFGVLLLLVLIVGVQGREFAAVGALVLLGIPPMLAATYSGVMQIQRTVIDAATAQGMTPAQVLWRVEVPLSLPVVLGGIRSAVLQIVATATLVAYVGLGGLGHDIIQGIPLRRFDQTVGAAIVIIVLAVVLDQTLAFMAKRAVPRGVTGGTLQDVRAREPIA